MRKLTQHIGLLLILLIFLMPMTALSSYAEVNKQRVYDEASLLTEEELVDLEQMSAKYSEKRETDFIILTTNASESALTFMQNFYDDNGLGYDKEHGNAAIITINMSNREVYLSGFYQAEKYLTNKRLDKIRNKITDDLTDGYYADAFEGFIKEADFYFDYEPNVNPDNIFYKTWFQFLIALLISITIVGVMLYQAKSKITTTPETYKDTGSSKVLKQTDRFIRRHVSKTYSPESKSKSGGGGGTTGGGHSHSGSGGRF